MTLYSCLTLSNYNIMYSLDIHNKYNNDNNNLLFLLYNNINIIDLYFLMFDLIEELTNGPNKI